MATKKNAALKERMNLTIEPVVISQGEELAKADRRSFSNLVEALITREYNRVFGKVSKKKQAMAA